MANPPEPTARRVPLAMSLPSYLTRFVGHEQERTTLHALLLSKRLLTLIGPGGIGKTRLALQVATDAAAAFPDGLGIIECASLPEPQLVLQALAAVLHLHADHDTLLLSLIITSLQESHALLIFDNCEHVLQACASLVEALLQACPYLHLLATSREPLAVTGEMHWRVAALSSPNPEQLPAFELLQSYEAIQLFCERAAESNSRFRLTPHNAAAIARLCHQLDGLPLALELAAALLPVLSVDQLSTRFNDHLRLLKHGKRTAPSRQQTLEATFEWSYALLSLNEQVLFQQLAIFADSWSLESVEQICTPALSTPSDIFALLVHLVNASLVIAEEHEGYEEGVTEVRYRLLETVRQYALSKLQQAGMWEQLCARHATWYLHLAEQANVHLHGTQQAIWLHYLELETANLRTALTRSLAAGHLHTVVRLADALRRFWITHNYLSEGQYWFETLLKATNNGQPLEPALRARVLFGAAQFARYQGALDHACALYEAQITLLETLDDASALAEARAYLGMALGLRGDYTQATQLCQSSLAFYREKGQHEGITSTLTSLAFVTLAQGDFLQAMTLSQEVCHMQRETGNVTHLLYALFTLAQAALLQGSIEQARSACQEALHLSQSQSNTYGLASSLGLIGGLASATGQPGQAARLFGAAHTLQELIHFPHPTAGQALQERMILSVHAALGKEAFLTHYTAGRTTPLEQILQEAETVLHNVPTPLGESPTASAMAKLTPREREILISVARGLTDTQIAQSLTLSRRTVSKHVQSIYTKLAINSRSAATRLALESGLI